MPTRIAPKHYVFFFLLLCSLACKKEVVTKIKEAAPFASAGTNQRSLTNFEVQLNADSLQEGQSGKWTVKNGLVEQGKVYFENENRPNAIFHGMPGEAYDLQWTVRNGENTFSEALVNISFKPLRASVSRSSVDAGTRIYLGGNQLDSSLWIIDRKYARIQSMQGGGTYRPELKSASIFLQGYSNADYKITFRTFYGSKSADTTIHVRTGDYTEDEALLDLQMDRSSRKVTIENGHVTKLLLNASGIAWILQDTVQFPALQALTHLKYLDLQGSSVSSFPVLFGSKYRELEYLNFSGCALSNIAENVGELKKLKHLIIAGLNLGARISSLPESFGDMESLEYFHCNAIGLQHIPESFSKLKNLKYFSGYLNPVRKLPDGLGDMRNLESLQVSTQENIPASVSKLKKLVRLYFVTTAADAKLPADFGNLAALDTLGLEGPFRELPQSFAQLKLVHLQLTTPPLASIPANFGDITTLEFLQIGGLLKTLPASICNLINLKNLITGGSIESLPVDFGRLKNLVYMECQFSSLSTLPESMGELDNLVELRLRNNRISKLPSGFFNMKRIEHIDLSQNQISILPDDFAKLRESLKLMYLYGNRYSSSNGSRIKELLPYTRVYLNSSE